MWNWSNLCQVLLVSGMATVQGAPIATKTEEEPAIPRRRSSTDESDLSCLYEADGAGSFNSYFSVDFTTASAIPDYLESSTYTVAAGDYAPYAREFETSNLIFTAGQPLQMLVPGNQTSDTISSSQMTTTFDDVLYCSVRTVAKASAVNGTVHGFFMYMNDTQETDVEIRTGDPGNVHYTNQELYDGAGVTTYSVAGASDMTTAFHEYRYDWFANETKFYFDGVLQQTISKNVPSKAGWLMWNNWSNGDDWTMGPPAEDNILEIQSITAYFNRTSVSSGTSYCSSSTTSSATAAAATTSTTSSVNALINEHIASHMSTAESS